MEVDHSDTNLLTEVNADDIPLSGSTVFSSIMSTLSSRTVSNFEDEIHFRPPSRIDIITPDLCAALDRANISSRNAIFIIASLLTSIGLNIANYNLSHRTIHRCRIKFRKYIATGLKNEFNIDDRFVLHWDGKILQDLIDPQSVERLPILLSVSGVEQLLGVPKMAKGDSESQTSAIITILKQWHVGSRIKAMCFDTTAVNTGKFNGTCVQIERILQRELVYLPCRHHILEVVLRAVFENYWPVTSGPNTPIFSRFLKKWDTIDQSKFQSGMADDIVAKVLTKEKHDLLTFINNYLQISHPRDDYKELLELSLIFLDDTPNQITHFKRPGAMHHARWMAKAIYSLKIFLFRSKFKLTARETKNLREICIFVVLFYIKAWFTSTSAILATNQDLKLMQKLVLYQEQNLSVSLAAIKKLFNHLWYLNEDLAVFALFDEDVPAEIKRQMVESMKSQEMTIIIEKRRTADKNSPEIFLNKNMGDFVSKQSLKLFDKFDLPHDFLDEDVLMWPDNESYQENLEFFKKLKVVNDVAERGVALVEEYNRCLTKDEEQFQYLLQVVKEHRGKYPNCNKKTLQQI